MHVEESGVVNQPVELVFDYVADPVNLPEWSGAAVEVRDLEQTTPGEPGKGDKFTPVHKFLGQRIEEHFEVTAYESNRRITHWSTGGPMPLEINHIFEGVPEGTRLTVSMDARSAGFLRLIGSVFKAAVKRQIRNDPGTLKSLLELRG